MKKSAESGLTLIELLVALLLLAVLAGMAYRGLESMTRTSQRVEAEATAWQSLAAFFERFASDVAQPSRRTVRVWSQADAPQAFVELPAWQGVASSADSSVSSENALLEFTRKSANGRAEMRLAYRLREGRIELLLWPSLDRQVQTKPEIYRLLEGVTALHLHYLDEAGQWQTTWPMGTDRSALPRALSMDLELSDGRQFRRVFALPI